MLDPSEYLFLIRVGTAYGWIVYAPVRIVVRVVRVIDPR